MSSMSDDRLRVRTRTEAQRDIAVAALNRIAASATDTHSWTIASGALARIAEIGEGAPLQSDPPLGDVARERERIAAWLDCPSDCRHADAGGACDRYDGPCSRDVADFIRRGELP